LKLGDFLCQGDNMWFEQLVGFKEQDASQVREQITVTGETMISAANGRRMNCGRLETPSLAELRAQVEIAKPQQGELRLSEVVGDVQQLHVDPNNAGALFQVASQFNLLEMVSPLVSPEDGVDRYEFDRTQGPACAIACGAGTIYRNYFAQVKGSQGVQTGQTESQQLDCLDELGVALGNNNANLWEMRNGYALATSQGLASISQQILHADDEQVDALRQKLRIGVQWNTEVTIVDSGHCVTQAYCSALPVAYSSEESRSWASFATLVLEAAYEATFCAALLNAEKTGNRTLFLTQLGGGAFGNSASWIISAIERSIERFAKYDLDVKIVSYGSSSAAIQHLVKP